MDGVPWAVIVRPSCTVRLIGCVAAVCVSVRLTGVSRAGWSQWVLSSPSPLFLSSPVLLFLSSSPLKCFFFLSLLVQPARSATLKDLLSATQLSPEVWSSCCLRLSRRSQQTLHNLNLSLQVWSANVHGIMSAALAHIYREGVGFTRAQGGWVGGWGLCQTALTPC